MGKLVKFVIGFFVGAITGTITALLLAPKAGFETRKEIQSDVETFIKEAESAVTGNYILLEMPKAAGEA